MNPHGPIEDRIQDLEDEIIRLKARDGRLIIPNSLLILLWTMLLTAVAGIAFVVRLDTRASELEQLVAEDHHTLVQHVSLPWHAAAGEKYQGIADRMALLEDRVKVVESRTR